MSVLADACAGKTRSRVTDRGAAYATISGILTHSQSQQPTPPSDETLVSISLKIINTSSIKFKNLIALREREAKENGNTIRDLRHRYASGLEKYAKRLTTEVANLSDAEEILRQFQSDMEDDLADLKSELGFARRDIILSKEILVAALASAGTIATVLFGTPWRSWVLSQQPAHQLQWEDC